MCRVASVATVWPGINRSATCCARLISIPGGFAEYIRVPKINVELGTLRIPDSMTFDEGSFIEPLACVVRAQRFAGMTAGQTVLVIGSGISGLLHIQLARGARRGADYRHRYQRFSAQGCQAIRRGRGDPRR